MMAVSALAMAAQPVLAQAIDASSPGVRGPLDELEQGLWMQMDEAERDLRTSQLIIRDPALNGYVRRVLCRTVGDAGCHNIRLYLIRTPQFNATAAPNGVMQIWSGLLVRTQNEAQLAAVLAHEYAHFEERHSVSLFRAAKSKSNAAAWLAFTGIGLIASFGLIGSLFKYSRDMETEADLIGLRKMAAAGYDAREAAVIWEQMRSEMDATAAARGTASRKDKTGGLFATHPPSAERIAYLTREAELTPGVPGEKGDDRYRAAMASWWPQFIDDQLKMNDFGASSFLLDSIAKSNGWTPWLNYARGELYRRRSGPGDLEKAVGYFSEAIEAQATLPELWRGRGLALLKLEQSERARADLQEYLTRAPEAADRGLIEMMSGETE